MKPPKELDGPLNPTKEELDALPMGATVYFDLIPSEVIWIREADPDLQRKRLEDLAAHCWLSDFKRGRERFVLLPGPDGEPTGTPLSVKSQEFRVWLVGRYHRRFNESLDTRMLESFVNGADFLMRVAIPQTRRRK